jgi:predicted TIM-barrel fold metal-dependent hydrolase
MANYGRIFRSRSEGRDPSAKSELADYVALLDRVGIARAVPFGVSNDEVAELLQDYPDRFIGLARISGLHGMRGVRGARASRARAEVRRARRLRAGGRHSRQRPRYYPLYAKAVELGHPRADLLVDELRDDRPYDLGHPRHLDQVAIDFPELTIIGGLGGWPWVNEMVALVRAIRSSTSTPPPTARSTSASGLRLGDADAVRQHAASRTRCWSDSRPASWASRTRR